MRSADTTMEIGYELEPISYPITQEKINSYSRYAFHNMLSDPASITDETLDIQAYCVRHTRFDSRKVIGCGTLLSDLAHLTCRLRLLWGAEDDAVYRPAKALIGQIQDVVSPLDLHRVPRAGHWSAYENAPEVNRLMLEFFTT